MTKETVKYSDEYPPDYSGQDQQTPKRRWWWRKRVWMPILILIILFTFGIVFGAVYGVKNSESEVRESDHDRLFAAQGWNSTSYSSRASYAATGTSSAGWGNPVVTPTPTGSYPYPTPGPPQSSGSMLSPQGQVPRDISAAVGASALILWDLRSEGKLWKKDYGGTWEVYNDRQFLVAPITVSTSESTQTAVSVDGISGRIVYTHFHDGQWDDWQELEFGAQFLRRPAVVSRAPGKIDVIGVDNEGHVWIVSYDGAEWSEWTELGTNINSEVTATSWGEDRIDVFVKSGESVLHKHWTSGSGWAASWDDLGNPFSGFWAEPGETASSPLAVSWLDGDDGVIDVFVTRRGSSHKLFKNGAWSKWTGMSASHEGYEFPDTQSIVRGDGVDGRPFAHLISRGTDDCIHYIAHNGTAWGSWTYIWCNKIPRNDYPTEFKPTFMAGGGSGSVDLVVRDLENNVLRLEVQGTGPDDWVYDSSNDKWENLGQPA